MKSSNPLEFDITVFGASGFTGRLAAIYLARTSLRIAIAGRNREKLEAIAAQCERPPSIVIADAADPVSIRSMVQRTRVLANFAGPFSLYAEPVIAAAAELGRHYCDITGETPFIKKMIARYHTQAEASGACLIPFAGFDSVPAELTSFLALQDAEAKGYRLDRLTHYYALKGGLNGGTLASALALAEQGESGSLYNPNLLIDEAKWPRSPSTQLMPTFEPVLNRWSAPFIMGPINTAVVRRSNYLRRKAGSKEETFFYEERMLFGQKLAGRLQAQAATAVLGVFGAMTQIPLGRKIARRLGPKPGEGPSDEKRKNSFYKGRLIGRSDDRPRVLVTMESQGDPGNETTITCAAEIAQLLFEGVHNEGNVQIKGFTTPSVAFALPLIERLRAAGMKFETKSL